MTNILSIGPSADREPVTSALEVSGRDFNIITANEIFTSSAVQEYLQRHGNPDLIFCDRNNLPMLNGCARKEQEFPGLMGVPVAAIYYRDGLPFSFSNPHAEMGASLLNIITAINTREYRHGPRFNEVVGRVINVVEKTLEEGAVNIDTYQAKRVSLYPKLYPPKSAAAPALV